MEKESVFEQIPPKVWIAMLVGGGLIAALLVWILTSSNPSSTEETTGGDAGTLASAETETISPDIPVQNDPLLEDNTEEGDESNLQAADADTEWVTSEAEDTEGNPDEVDENEAVATDTPDRSQDYVSAVVDPDKAPPQPVEVAAQTSASLVDSDSAVRRNFSSLGDAAFYKALWRPNNLLQRWVTFTFGLSKGQVMRQVVSLQTPKPNFPVRRVGARYFLDESGFERYTPYIKTLQSIPPATWAENFHYFRPLLEKIFGQMGYDASNFDNTVTKALHEIISATIPTGAMELKAPSAMYVFVDKNLENMTPLQKQLVRMGPKNAQVLQEYAVQVRERLLKGG